MLDLISPVPSKGFPADTAVITRILRLAAALPLIPAAGFPLGSRQFVGKESFPQHVSPWQCHTSVISANGLCQHRPEAGRGSVNDTPQLRQPRVDGHFSLSSTPWFSHGISTSGKYDILAPDVWLPRGTQLSEFPLIF